MPLVRTIFIYTVMFATLMMTVGGGVAAFMALADIVSPHAYYQSFTDYKTMRQSEHMRLYEIEKESGIAPENLAPLSEEQLRKEYDELVASEMERTRRSAVNSLFKSLGWIVIPLPIFFYMRRMLRNSKA